MNKSKFLKKSLAALLAILMVAAMIPLSAAASDEKFVGPDGQDTISVDGAGKLSQPDTADESNWTVTLPYNEGDSATIRVSTVRKGQFDVYTSLDGAELAPSATGSVVTVEGVTVAASKTATIVLRPVVAEDEEPQEDITYNFKVVKTATSNDPTVTAAEATMNGDTYKGSKVIVSDSKITVTVPWGKLPADQGTPVTSATMKVTMASQPVATTSPNNVFNPDSVSLTIDANNKGQITVYAQDNKTTKKYDVEFVEESALKSVTIGGVAAEQNASDAKGKTWTVKLPTSKVGGSNTAVPVRVSAGKIVANTWVAARAHNAAVGTPSFPSTAVGSRPNVDLSSVGDGDKIDLAIKDSAANATGVYTITIETVKSSEKELKSFKAAVTVGGNEYTETATISGNRINLMLPKDTTVSNGAIAVTAGKVTATQSANATVKVEGVAIANVTSLKKGESRVTVTAEDKSVANYILTVDTADNTTPAADAKITKATMILGSGATAKKYVGRPSGKTITFTIPNSVSKADTNEALGKQVKGNSSTTTKVATFEWETSPHSLVVDGATTPLNVTVPQTEYYVSDGAANPTYTKMESLFAEDWTNLYTKDTVGSGQPQTYTAVTTAVTPVKNEVVVKSDGDTSGDNKWTIVFKQDAAYTAHALNSITFYAADTKGEVKDENTYTTTKSGNTVTVDKEIPYEDSKSGTTTAFIAEYNISERAKLYWADAAGVLTAIGAYDEGGYKEDGTKNTAAAIGGDDLVSAKKLIVVSEAGWNGASLSDTGDLTSGTYTEYTLNVKGTPVSDGKDILSLASTDGLVTSVIDTAAGTIVLTVPTDYVVKDSETYFDLKIEVSPLTQKPVSGFDDEGISENAQVKGNDTDGYKLYLGGSVCEGITVVAEDGSQKYYKLTAQAAELDDDNSLSGITVKDVAATEGEDGWTVELPYGTDLENITADDVVATVADKAEAAVVKNEDGTYTITVTAENQSKAEYTLTVTVADEPENPFTDIGDPNDPNNWSASSIITASQNGWILGMGNGKFGPKGQMTRAQFALIIARIKAGSNDAWEEIAGDYTTDVYDDVSATNDYMNAIAYVTEEGIMSGKGAGKFDPNGTITRQEAAKVMAVASGLEEIPGNTTYSDDASIAGWAKGYVNAVTENNIMNGMGAGFSPNVKLTREMGATILVRAFDKADEPDEPDEPTE